MKNKLYLTTEIGKVYVEIGNDGYQFYKVIDSKFVELNSKEKKAINDKLMTSNLILFDKVLDILKENHSLATAMITGVVDNVEMDNIFTKKILDEIEHEIPEDNRDIFYNNLKNLNIKLLSPDFIHSSLVGDYSGVGELSASYLIDKNTIVLSKNIIDVLKDKAIKLGINDSDLFVKNNMQKILKHELFHMASSEYDPATGTFYSGLITTDGKGKTKAFNNNLGLTEGITEALATKTTGDGDYLERYTAEQIIASELINIFGLQTIKEVYFKDHNINRLIKGLCDIDAKTYVNEEVSKKNATDLFKKIELNFAYNGDGRQNILGDIQKRMAAYFIQKIDIDTEEMNNMSEGISKEEKREELQNRCASFDKMFSLTKNFDQNKYEGLDDAYRFYKEYSVLFNIDMERGKEHEI